MSTKIKTSTFLFLLLLASNYTTAQNTWLEIVKTDNSDKKVELSLLNKVTFSATDLVLNYYAGGEENIPRAEIRKLVFATSTGTQTPVVRGNFRVFPNPASDFIYLQNIPEGQYTITVYSITGAQIFNIKTTAISNPVDIRSLKKGMYILKANNFVTKFTKE